MEAIKEYKEMCIITRKNWEEIWTASSLEELESLINNWPQMIRFWNELVNKYEITWVKKVAMNDIDTFIAWITDLIMRDRLKAIVKERKSKWLKISWTQHLMTIYESRFQKSEK